VKTFLVTGATRGLGLAIARALAADSAHRVVLGVRDLGRGEQTARSLGGNVEAHRLDCASLADVRRFAAEWRAPLAGLVNNAGVQLTGTMQRSADGFEETLAVNHLAALELTVRMLPLLAGGRVLFIGSGTHNPDHRMASLFGFRGAHFTSIEALARGEANGRSDRQRGMDRYATSKFLNMLTAMELARRIPRDRTVFLTLDPGLMAGTGLVRSAPAAVRFAWARLLPRIAPLLPDTSTPARSASAAVWLLTDPGVIARHGEVFSFDCRPSTRVWPPARDPQLGRRALDESLAFLGLPAGPWET
jgi:NAD(P)-dependent dehydrogenase (short-subunit alcohol dehydrogenase family)